MEDVPNQVQNSLTPVLITILVNPKLDVMHNLDFILFMMGMLEDFLGWNLLMIFNIFSQGNYILYLTFIVLILS
jgi:hypothetical protein